MKIPEFKNFVRYTPSMMLVMALFCLLTISGCEVALGFFLTPGPFEKKTTPAYDLQAQQDRKVLIWIECPRSANADFDVAEKLATAFQLTLIQKGDFESENIIINPVTDSGNLSLDPVKIARSKGAGYVLLIQVDEYSTDSLRVRDYYSGELVTRAVLQDTDLGDRVWPSQPEGKMIHISVEMETDGRDALVSRLASAAAHCTLRNLYPCDPLKFKHADERISMQEAYEIETY